MTTLRSIFRALLSGNAAPSEPTISEVETRASAQGYSVDAIVADPLRFDIFEGSFRRFCADHADELLPRLKHQVSTRPVKEQIVIARMLLGRGDASAGNILLNLLEAGDIEAQRQAIVALSMRNIGRAQSAPIDETRALRLLRPWLQTAQIHWRKTAAQVLFSLSLPEVREVKLATLIDPALPLRLAAATTLAREGDAAAWPVLRDVLLAKDDQLQHERYSAIASLKALVAVLTDPLRDEVVREAACQIEAQLDRDDNTTANEVWNLLAVIEAAAPTWETSFLERVIASRLMPWPRGIALRRLAKLQGLAALARLRASLDDPELALDALHALINLGVQAATADVVGRIQTLINDTENAWVATTAADALTALGHGDDPVLVKHVDKLNPWERFAVTVRAKKLSAETFVALLEDAGVFDKARLAAAPDVFDGFRTAWQDRKEAAALFELLMGTKALHSFDTEDDRVPPNYTELLADLAEIARPRFRIDKISMRSAGEREPGATHHEILLLFDGRPVRILVKDVEDWFDVGGLLGQLNTEIAASGKPERFVTLHTGDQSAQVVLGHATRLLVLRRNYHFPIADDPDASMRVGQEFERQVIDELEGRRK